jgi:hypothetical protein
MKNDLLLFLSLPVAFFFGINTGYAIWHEEPAAEVVREPEAIIMRVGEEFQFKAYINGCEVTYGPLEVPREGYSAYGIVCPEGEGP